MLLFPLVVVFGKLAVNVADQESSISNKQTLSPGPQDYVLLLPGITEGSKRQWTLGISTKSF